MRSIFSYWNFNFATISFLLIIVGAYFYTINFHLKKQSFYFFSGIFLIVVCVASPLHYIGENYLFSAHMLSHVLLLLIAAPLLVAGMPVENKGKKIFVAVSKRIKNSPVISWIIGVGIMWLWHIPFIFKHLVLMKEMALTPDFSVDILMKMHMVSLVTAGVIFCLPVINPYKEYRMASLPVVLYLSSACIACSLLGLLITFAPPGTYTGYISNNNVNGFLSIVRNQWKISSEADQQIGGLIMWVPCCFIYLSVSMIVLIKWFEQKNTIPPIESGAMLDIF